MQKWVYITFVIWQEIKKGLSHFLSSKWLCILQAFQKRSNGVVLSFSVYSTNPVPLRQLTLPQKIENIAEGREPNNKEGFHVAGPTRLYFIKKCKKPNQ